VTGSRSVAAVFSRSPGGDLAACGCEADSGAEKLAVTGFGRFVRLGLIEPLHFSPQRHRSRIQTALGSGRLCSHDAIDLGPRFHTMRLCCGHARIRIECHSFNIDLQILQRRRVPYGERFAADAPGTEFSPGSASRHRFDDFQNRARTAILAVRRPPAGARDPTLGTPILARPNLFGGPFFRLFTATLACAKRYIL